MDANNAFNSLNRKVALNNIKYVCPEFSTYLLNTYRHPSKLYVADCKEDLLSNEGTTQGDNAAMGFYACSLTPLINKLESIDTPKQVWYADDSAAGGTLKQLLIWWKHLCEVGPWYGYHPKPSKTVLIVKDGFEEEAKRLFPGITITTTGHKYLGSFIGKETGKRDFIAHQIAKWEKDIKALADIATREPQAAYSAFVYGTSKRWLYVARTTPNISDDLKRLDWIINEQFVPAIIGREFITDTMRHVFTLQVKHGGLGITNISETANMEYENSKLITKELTELIYNQENSMNMDQKVIEEAMDTVERKKAEFHKNKRSEIYNKMNTKEQRILDLASEKGASSWLTSLPLAEFGFTLNKQEFQDAVLLRYDFRIKNVAAVCACGEQNSVDHALTCKLGGYVSLRHNSLRDTTAELLRSHGICKDVETEPSLLPVSGQHLSTGSVLGDDARLDVSARNLWTPLARAFLDIRVFHPQAQTNSVKSIPAMYSAHEQEKKRKYNSRVINVEKATFTPVVFSTSGGWDRKRQSYSKGSPKRCHSKLIKDIVTSYRSSGEGSDLNC